MRIFISVILMLLVSLSGGTSVYARGYSGGQGTSYSLSHSNSRSVYVHGYTKKNGTYVAPHHRSAPNHTKSDNWSTKGNINPYTGKVGTKNP